MSEKIYDIFINPMEGGSVTFQSYLGNVLLIVNTASKCGFTLQYAGLEDLYQRFKGRGFEILGFPCDQFGHQEPGSNEEIGSFCERSYGISFPMFNKVDVNGRSAHLLYQYLKREAPGIFGSERIKWNFTKFIVDRSGRVVGRYSPTTKPNELASIVESLL